MMINKMAPLCPNGWPYRIQQEIDLIIRNEDDQFAGMTMNKDEMRL